MRLGFVGAGYMAQEHAKVFRYLGCQISAVTSRLGSPKLLEFQKQHEGTRIYDSWTEMISSKKLDAIVVCTPPETSRETFQLLLSTGIPALIEKPGAVDSKDLDALIRRNSQLYFAYNRRFYESILHLRNLVSEKGFFNFDLIESDLKSKNDRTQILKNNSVHMFDLIRFLIPEPTLNFVSSDSSGSNFIYKIEDLENSSVGILRVSFGAIRNQQITWDSVNLSVTVKPIEYLTAANSFEVSEPTADLPIRRYVPIMSTSEFPSSVLVDTTFKPGILGQAVEFLKLLRDPSEYKSSLLAKPIDAFQALTMAEKISENL